MPRAPKAPGHSPPREAWAGSARRSELPAEWPVLRIATRERAGGRCEGRDGDHRCRKPGTDCDHIVPGPNHSLDNLQWLCGYHHRRKTAIEGATAARRRQ